MGYYEFISDGKKVTERKKLASFKPLPFSEKYTKIGVADGQSYGKDSLCTFTIYGNKYKGRNKTGEMFSPTYPGTLLLFHQESSLQ